MKKRVLFIICALFICGAHAANENIPTSKAYVDAELATRQPQFQGLGNDKLMLYSNTTDGVVNSRDIVTTLGSGTSDTTVSTVGAINTGINTKQDALNGSSGWVAEHTGINGAIAPKPVYSTTDNYENALIDAATLNTAIVNAVNSELTVIPGVGWRINTANDIATLSTPQTYADVPPGGYTQLEYIEAVNGPYIDTLLAGDSDNLRIVVKFKLLSFEGLAYNNRYFSGILGNYKNESSNVYRLLLTSNKASCSTQNDCWILLRMYANTVANAGSLVGVYLNLNQDYIVDFSQTKSFVNDTASRLSSIKQGSENNKTIRLFSGSVGTTTNRSDIRIYYFAIYNNGNKVRNMIPAQRNSDGAIGMYDTVTNTFFTNVGTGTFTTGSSV